MITLKQFNEAKEMLDISIENIEKLSPEKLKALLNQHVTVTEKVDGTKLTLVRNNRPFSTNWEDNWILAYKNNIISPDDFHGVDDKRKEEIKSGSFGIGQYKLALDAIAAAHPNTKSVPLNTEFFIEFMMRKGTLTRQYDKYHSMILLAWSPTKYRIVGDRLFTESSEFNVEGRDKFAQMLGVAVPRVLFDGLLSEWVEGSTDIIQTLKEVFLDIKSQFGGKMEGVVFEFENGQIFKLLQADQHDQQVRADIKSKLAPKDPDRYWKVIRQAAEFAVNQLNGDDYKENVKQLSKFVYQEDLEQIDPNRSVIQMRDDIFLTAKTILQRTSPGNNNAMFLGRFSPLTIAHYKIIEDAIKKYDHVTVAIIKSKIDKDNPFPVEMQQEMLKKCFGPGIEVFVASTGNLITLMQKSKFLISTILAGTDRVEGYTNQLKHSPDVKVVEIPRTDGVSGTMVRKFLKDGNREEFEKYTPQPIWSMFDTLKKLVDQQV